MGRPWYVFLPTVTFQKVEFHLRSLTFGTFRYPLLDTIVIKKRENVHRTSSSTLLNPFHFQAEVFFSHSLGHIIIESRGELVQVFGRIGSRFYLNLV